MSKKKSINVVMACVNASGSPEFVAAKVHITQKEYDLGAHYDQAKDLALENEYEEPIVCFDEKEMPAFLLTAFNANQIHFL